MQQAGHMLAQILRMLSGKTNPGVSTKELANLAAVELMALGGTPSFLGYQGFPDVICISVNDEVVHGIPDKKRILKDGDIVGLDFGVTYKGMMTDGAVTVIAGQPLAEEHVTLLKATKRALGVAINRLRDQVQVGDISAAIESELKAGRYGIPHNLVGHGIGRQLWEEPSIPNYGKAHTGPVLRSGMTIAIEPMVTLGTNDVYVDSDGWTIKTKDGSFAAHFEHTVLILDKGAEILTH